MVYCGLCKECVEDWDIHSTSPDHVNNKKEFFTDEAGGIELVRNWLHLSSRLNAHVIYMILKDEYAK